MSRDLTGAEMIAYERKRQIERLGFTAERDEKHRMSELTAAAHCYMRPYTNAKEKRPDIWPWDPKAWKPSNDPVRNLVKAGALIAAEIDRIKASLEKYGTY